MKSVILFVFAVMLAVAASARASEKGPFEASSGASVLVLSYASFNPDTCYFGALPRLRLVTPPVHGTATFGTERRAADEGRCEGKTFGSSTVHYRSKPGYRGPDEMVVEAVTDLYSNGIASRGDRVRITIDVR